MREKYQIEITGRDIWLEEGRKTYEVAQSLFRKYGLEISEEESKQIAKLKQESYLNSFVPKIYPEIPGILNYLKRVGLKTAIVTGTWRPNVDKALPAELAALFNDFVTSETYQKGKPDPEPFLNGAKLLGVKHEECIVLENAPLGVRAGKTAGMHVIAVCTTLEPNDLKEADEVATNFEEVLVKLKAHFG